MAGPSSVNTRCLLSGSSRRCAAPPLACLFRWGDTEAIRSPTDGTCSHIRRPHACSSTKRLPSESLNIDRDPKGCSTGGCGNSRPGAESSSYVASKSRHWNITLMSAGVQAVNTYPSLTRAGLLGAARARLGGTPRLRGDAAGRGDDPGRTFDWGAQLVNQGEADAGPRAERGEGPESRCRRTRTVPRVRPSRSAVRRSPADRGPPRSPTGVVAVSNGIGSGRCEHPSPGYRRHATAQASAAVSDYQPCGQIHA